MPRVSIITPTIDRQHFLPALWDCVRTQSIFNEIEWFIHDGTQREATFDWINANPNVVRYLHAPGLMTIGAKRNLLCGASTGEIIVHFDDDDYYGPGYVEGMLSFMMDLNVDFVKLFGFFLYQRAHQVLAYWDLERDFPRHYCFSRQSNPSIALYRGGATSRWWYGFSYVYHRRVLGEVVFPDRGHGEDHEFAEKVVARFRSAGKQDFACSCLHVIHADNMSKSFPQQILPRDLLAELFPQFRPPTV